MREGERFFLERNAQKRLKGGHRREAPIEPEDKLIQVSLQVLRLDSVMGPRQPSL